MRVIPSFYIGPSNGLNWFVGSALKESLVDRIGCLKVEMLGYY